jgi:hypothetical protein
MDTMPTSRAAANYLDKAPILIGASSHRARASATDAIERAGWRVADAVSIEMAQERIERQASATAVWIELDRDCGGAMDALLAQISKDVSVGRYAAIVCSAAALIDPISASISESAIELLVDPDEAERASALALAAARAGWKEARLSDVASDQSAARLRQLSDEVSRIAASLARLSSAPPSIEPALRAPAGAEFPPVSAETVRGVIRARRLRARYFADHLFADPAWDMLLDLFQAEIAQLRVPVSSLCIAAAVPATTALRWLKTMVEEGLFVRRADPHDGRRVFVELAAPASDALRRYFGEVGQVVVI